jgi:hypothetical protein
MEASFQTSVLGGPSPALPRHQAVTTPQVASSLAVCTTVDGGVRALFVTSDPISFLLILSMFLCAYLTGHCYEFLSSHVCEKVYNF